MKRRPIDVSRRRIEFQLDPALVVDLDCWAVRRGMSRSAAAEQLLRLSLDAAGKVAV